MPRQHALPEGWTSEFGRALVVVTSDGEHRQRLLRETLDEVSASDGRTWGLDCRFGNGGPWAGVRDLFAAIFPELREQRPDLVAKHDYELVHVLPALQEWLEVRNPNLTDISSPEEKVRNYPADRALRIVHGLIDLLDVWKGASNERWTLICDGFDQVGHIGGTFFRELLRRRGERLRIAFLAVTDPAGDGRVHELLSELISRCVRLELPACDPDIVDCEASAQAARALDKFMEGDRLRMQVHLPEILRLARHGKLRDLEIKWKFKALEIYNNQGLYADALVYGEDVRAVIAARPRQAPPSVRWATFLKLIMSYLGLGRAEAAFQLAMEVTHGPALQPEWHCQLCYLLAMLHGRYLAVRDLAKAEEYLEDGWRVLAEATDLREDRLHFQRAFNRNGLAMIRHFQGRFTEAIDLCRDSHARLETHLDRDRHRLHRSVLLYNLSQVYTALGEGDEAIAYLTAAIEMDPNYSEYYNDRGNIHLGQRRPVEASQDYTRAIELSPPYPEVFANLGQALRLMGRMEEAIHAYSTSLDLDPGQLLPLIGRGQCHDAEGRLIDAISDYTAAIEVDPEKWDAFALRGVAHYGVADLNAALADLNRAIELAPDIADLYANRATAMLDLGRFEEAARDLRTYLFLRPEAEDRDEVEARLRTLDLAQVAVGR